MMDLFLTVRPGAANPLTREVSARYEALAVRLLVADISYRQLTLAQSLAKLRAAGAGGAASGVRHNAVDAQMSMLLATVQDTPSRFQLHECGDARLMRQPAPMLLGRAKDLFDQPDWSYEPKWDGFRVPAAKISR